MVNPASCKDLAKRHLHADLIDGGDKNMSLVNNDPFYITVSSNTTKEDKKKIEDFFNKVNYSQHRNLVLGNDVECTSSNHTHHVHGSPGIHSPVVYIDGSNNISNDHQHSLPTGGIVSGDTFSIVGGGTVYSKELEIVSRCLSLCYRVFLNEDPSEKINLYNVNSFVKDFKDKMNSSNIDYTNFENIKSMLEKEEKSDLINHMCNFFQKYIIDKKELSSNFENLKQEYMNSQSREIAYMSLAKKMAKKLEDLGCKESNDFMLEIAMISEE